MTCGVSVTLRVRLDLDSWSLSRTPFLTFQNDILCRNTALTALNSCSMLAGSQREKLAALIESAAASAAETLKLEAQEPDELIDDTDSREAKEILREGVEDVECRAL